MNALRKVNREKLTLSDIDKISHTLGQMSTGISNLGGQIREIKEDIKGFYDEMRHANDRAALTANKTDRAHERIDEVHVKIKELHGKISSVDTKASDTKTIVERWRWVLGGIVAVVTVFANTIFAYVKGML